MARLIGAASINVLATALATVWRRPSTVSQATFRFFRFRNSPTQSLVTQMPISPAYGTTVCTDRHCTRTHTHRALYLICHNNRGIITWWIRPFFFPLFSPPCCLSPVMLMHCVMFAVAVSWNGMSDTTRGAGITVGRIDAICPMMCYFVEVRQQTGERNGCSTLYDFTV